MNLIENNSINRLAFKIFRRHLIYGTLDRPAGRYADRKISRLIFAALRVAKGSPQWHGDLFEDFYFRAMEIARKGLARSTGGEYPSVDETIATTINKLNQNIERWGKRDAKYEAQRFGLAWSPAQQTTGRRATWVEVNLEPGVPMENDRLVETAIQ